MTHQPLYTTGKRIHSIDLLRGLVMVIMALDHTRDFFFQGAFAGSPTDLATTTPALFFTRWVTHFCAPTFVMLSGTSAFLYGHKQGKKSLSIFLLTRGLWLMLLEVTLVRFGWSFNASLYGLYMLQVIWAIGACMVLMSALVWLHTYAVIFIGLIIVFGHNLLDGITYTPDDGRYIPWAIFFSPSPIPAKNSVLYTLYPIIPWLGVMACGFGIGKLYTHDVSPRQRRNVLFVLGCVCLGLFVLLRTFNIYGNPAHWQMQNTGLFSFLSFINVEKYPPSLLFLLVLLGPALIFLSMVEKMSGWLSRFFITIGRVPLFYYLLHIYVIHAGAFALFFASGNTWNDLNHKQSPLGLPSTFGVSLPWVYVAWICVVLLLYPLCKWYGNFKQKSTWRGWSYL